MSEGKRPGGLTALAVLNFIGGGIMVLFVLGMATTVAIFNIAANSEEIKDNPDMQEAVNAWQEIGGGVFYLMFALTILSAFLLIASGVGYLKQKRLLGRIFGNVWAVMSVGTTLTTVYLMKDVGSSNGFDIGTIIGLVYPGLTLILLNTTFKEDFTG